MKLFSHIINVLLVVAILNTIVSKSLHEVLEHTEVIEACCDERAAHFHEYEVHHQDFICNFNFSANSLVKAVFSTAQFIQYKSNAIHVHFLWIVDNLYFTHLLLRGPPAIK
ncbi:MAG: hypothetical protein J5I47_07570 [Vicingus serpentipes]|nr:hypothetical protein [Vicingus serpentipes]